MTGTTLITGATGYLGRLLTDRLLDTSTDRLLLGVRPTADGQRPAGLPDDPRISLVELDLDRPDAFAAIEPVTRIAHIAAVTRFTVERELAERVNVGGTVQALAFARRCPQLERFTLVSTVYSAGRRTGVLPAEPFDGSSGFVNHYEWSKWQAENHTLAASGDLSVTILRPGTIVADDESGTVRQYNAFHKTFKLFFYGLLSVVPGDPATPVHLTSGQATAEATALALDPGTAPGIYYATLPDPPSLGEIIDTAFSAFDQDQSFRRRRLLRPPYCDRRGFQALLEVARSTRSGAVCDALEAVSPFADQLYLHKQPTGGVLSDKVPNARVLIANACDYLVATRWGRNPKEIS